MKDYDELRPAELDLYPRYDLFDALKELDDIPSRARHRLDPPLPEAPGYLPQAHPVHVESPRTAPPSSSVPPPPAFAANSLERAFSAFMHSNLDDLEDPSDLVRVEALKHISSFKPYVSDPSPWVRAEVASLTKELNVLHYLSSDPSPWVRLQVASNPLLDPSTLMLLSGDSSEDVTSAVLKHPSCPKTTLLKGLSHTQAQFVLTALENPSLNMETLASAFPISPNRHLFTKSRLLPPEALEQLVLQDNEIKAFEALSQCPTRLPQHAEEMILSSTPLLRSALARTPVSSETASRLSLDSSSRVRASLAACTAYAEVLDMLCQDTIPFVRLHAASNPHLSINNQVSLAGDDGQPVKRRFSFSRDELDGPSEPPGSNLAQNPCVDSSVLMSLLGRSDLSDWHLLSNPKADINFARAFITARALPAEYVWQKAFLEVLKRSLSVEAYALLGQMR